VDIVELRDATAGHGLGQVAEVVRGRVVIDLLGVHRITSDSRGNGQVGACPILVVGLAGRPGRFAGAGAFASDRMHGEVAAASRAAHWSPTMTQRRATTVQVWAALAAVYAVWGSTYLAIRVGVRTMPPFLMA